MTDKEEKKYIRMTFNERIQHFFLLSSFITLVITGFALKFPDSLWVKGLFKVFGENSFEWRGIIHRSAAVVMVTISLYHLFYISFTIRGRKLVKDLWFKKGDLTDLIFAFKYYLGKSKSRPKFGRFSYIEKAEYWAVVWGTIVMGGTGTVLWFENTFLPMMSNSGMNIATAIHYYEAILASLAILVWHFYFVIFNPDVYPMNKAWLTGVLTREEMELEHPLELERIEEEENNKKETEVENEMILEKEMETLMLPLVDNVKSDVIESEEDLTKNDADNEIFGQYNPQVNGKLIKVEEDQNQEPKLEIGNDNSLKS